jgi:glycosyltransferase involved in cell wall biosynthesis
LPDPKIVAMYRIQNEGRWIEKSIDSILDICSKIIILDDNSTDDTLEICQSFDKVNVIHQDNLPLDQVRDKNKLLKIVLKQNPDYVLSLDGDEILTPHSKEILFEEINVLYPENSVFTFQVLYVWDKPNQIRSDGFFQSVWRSRFYKIKSQSDDLHYKNSIFRGNLHCSTIPDNVDGLDTPVSSNMKILHYGYYDKELRTRKYNWAESYKLINSEQGINEYLISGKGPRSGPNGIELQNLPNWMHVGKI